MGLKKIIEKYRVYEEKELARRKEKKEQRKRLKSFSKTSLAGAKRRKDAELKAKMKPSYKSAGTRYLSSISGVGHTESYFGDISRREVKVRAKAAKLKMRAERKLLDLRRIRLQRRIIKKL